MTGGVGQVGSDRLAKPPSDWALIHVFHPKGPRVSINDQRGGEGPRG